MTPAVTKKLSKTKETSISMEILQEYKLTIPFNECTYDEAKKLADSECKYLVVYLHCPTHENTHEFLTRVLSDDEVLAHFSESAILWGASVMNSTGYSLARSLHAETFPFIAILFQREVALRVQGFVDKSKLLASWKKCTEVWDGIVAQAISVQAERRVFEEQRNAQEAADAAMELADIERLAQLEREEQAKVDEAAKIEQERERQRERERESERAKERERLREQRRQDIIQAAQQSAQMKLSPEPKLEESHVVHIALRCPSGKTHRRRFRQDEFVDQLYNFAITLDEFKGGAVELISGVPPKQITCDRKTTTFAQVRELHPRAAVNVRYLAFDESLQEITPSEKPINDLIK